MRGETSNTVGGAKTAAPQRSTNAKYRTTEKKKNSITENDSKHPESKLTEQELRRLAAARGRQPRSTTTHTHNLLQSTGRGCRVYSATSTRININQKKPSTMSNEAYVTLATNDGYAVGALVLGHSLLSVGTSKHLCILITPNVSDPVRAQLGTIFHELVVVDVLDSKDTAHLGLLKRPELGVTFTKMHCWTLTQYTKCVFLDADMLAVQNPDELFQHNELSAACDIGWPDCFNSGMFVYSPSQETYTKLVDHAAKEGSFDGGDQGLLNTFFPNWNRLSFLYNMVVSATYTYLPAYKQYGSGVKLVHFLGIKKPWQHSYDPRTGQVSTAPGYQHMASYLNGWWNIYTRLVHPALPSLDIERAAETKPHFELSPPTQLLSEDLSKESTYTRPTAPSTTAESTIQTSTEREVKKIHYKSHVFSVETTEQKTYDEKPKDTDSKQSKLPQAVEKVPELEMTEKKSSEVKNVSGDDKTDLKVDTIPDPESKPEQASKESIPKVSKPKKDDHFIQPYPIYQPKPYEPYQPYLIDRHFINKYRGDVDKILSKPEFSRSRRSFSEIDTKPIIPVGYFPQGGPPGRSSHFPYRPRPRHESPLSRNSRDVPFNCSRDPRIPYSFVMPQIPKPSQTHDRPFRRDESPCRPSVNYQHSRRNGPSSTEQSLSPPRNYRESRPLLRRQMYRDGPNFPYHDSYTNPNFIEFPFLPPHRDSSLPKRSLSPHSHRRRNESPAAYGERLLPRDLSPCVKKHHESPHRNRDASPQIKRDSVSNKESQTIEKTKDQRQGDEQIGNNKQSSHSNKLSKGDVRRGFQNCHDPTRQRYVPSHFEDAGQFYGRQYNIRGEKMSRPSRFVMEPDHWPWESFNNSSSDMRQGTAHRDLNRSRESSLTRQRDFPRRESQTGRKEGEIHSSNSQIINGRNKELSTQMGDLKVDESLDDSRQRWERGQPEYAGRDSFSNIQAYINERLKQNK